MKSKHPGVAQPCGGLHSNMSRSLDFIRPTSAESETFLDNVHSIFFVGLVAKNCCFLCLTRHSVTCHFIVLHMEEIVSFQGLLKTSYL